jgi:hypothetical protein
MDQSVLIIRGSFIRNNLQLHSVRHMKLNGDKFDDRLVLVDLQDFRFGSYGNRGRGSLKRWRLHGHPDDCAITCMAIKEEEVCHGRFSGCKGFQYILAEHTSHHSTTR